MIVICCIYIYVPQNETRGTSKTKQNKQLRRGKKEGENRRARKKIKKKHNTYNENGGGWDCLYTYTHYIRPETATRAVTIVAAVYAHMSVRMGTSHRNCTPGYKRASAGIG